MRSAFLDASVPAGPVLVLAAWTVLGTVLTARTFRWD
jgi:ABC-2 type transport system permease protein